MAVAFDVGNKSTVGATVSSISYTGPTVGTLTDGLVAVSVQVRGASSDANTAVSSGTYAGNAMTIDRNQLASDSGGAAGSLRAAILHRVNPGSGAQTVVVNFTGTVNHATVYTGSFSGVDQSSPVGNTTGAGDATNSSPTSTISTSITTTGANSALVDSIYHKIGTSLTRGASQNLISTESFPNGGGDTSDASYKLVAAAGATSMSWTLTGNDGWVHAVVEFKQTAAAVTTRHLGLLGVGT